MPSEQEMRLHRCCFTGHRQEKLSGSPEEVKQWLSDQIMYQKRVGGTSRNAGCNSRRHNL